MVNFPKLVYMKKFFITIFSLLLFSNCCYAEIMYLSPNSFIKNVKVSYDRFIENKDVSVQTNDKYFYEYLNEINYQVELMNKWDVLNISNENNYKIFDKLSMKTAKCDIGVAMSEGMVFFIPNYQNIIDKNKMYISPTMLEWLEYLKTSVSMVEDASLLIGVDEVRNNIVTLDELLKTHPDFVAKADVIKEIERNLNIYLNGLPNTPLYDNDNNVLRSEVKLSYEKFLNENKKCSYYTDILDIYNKLKLNNFKRISTEFTINIEDLYTKKINDKKKTVTKTIRNFILYDFWGLQNPNEDLYQQNNQTNNLTKQSDEFINNSKKEIEMYLTYIFEDVYTNYGITATKNNHVISNIDEALDDDSKTINAKFSDFLANKNNMSKNYDTYNSITSYIKQYDECLEDYKNIYKQAYELYKADLHDKAYNFYKTENNSINYKLDKYKLDDFINEFGMSDKNKGQNIIKNIEDNQNQMKSFAKQIYDYSYAYEKTKTLNYMKAKGKKQDGKTISAFVYVASYYTPSSDYIYNYNYGSYPLYVSQVLNNGIMVRGDYSLMGHYGNTSSQIFIQTNKKYASNQALKPGTYYLYTGIKKYNTVLGAQNAVWQFKELSNKEVQSNFDIGQKLYFYRNH